MNPFSCAFNNILDKNGMMVKRHKRDESTVTITAIGNERIKSPEPSGMLAKGKMTG